MLMRSASTPVLNSWIPHSKDFSPEPEIVHQIPRTRSITLTSSMDESTKKITRAVSDSDLRDLSKKNRFNRNLNGVFVEAKARSFDGWFDLEDVYEVGLNGLLVDGIGGDGGGRICGGGKGGGGCDDDDNGSGFWDLNGRNESTDAYYKKMIQDCPGNALLLGNYARFLKEVCGDVSKAEEYCGRAILENPNDENVLAMYADIIWETQKDAPRAQTYFDKAIKAAPDDCYVLASYAQFLWNSVEEDEEILAENCRTSTGNFCHGIVPPLAAAS